MASTMSPDGSGSPSRGDRKRTLILGAAQQVFFAYGFVGASMDQVAAEAGVSKQTVYKHFSDKRTLFREVVTNVVRAREVGITAEMLLSGDGSFEEQIRSFARFFLKGVMQPDVLRLRRLVIGEAQRFPELGAVFYELGPKRAAEQLARALGDSDLQYGSFAHDPLMAAEYLLSLMLSIPLDRAMLLGDDYGFTEEMLERYADEGVRVFLRAYS